MEAGWMQDDFSRDDTNLKHSLQRASRLYTSNPTIVMYEV